MAAKRQWKRMKGETQREELDRWTSEVQKKMDDDLDRELSMAFGSHPLDPSAIKELLKMGAKPMKNFNNYRPNLTPELVSLLIRHGVDPNSPEFIYHALISAGFHKVDNKIVFKLLDLGADINKKMSDGSLILHKFLRNIPTTEEIGVGLGGGLGLGAYFSTIDEEVEQDYKTLKKLMTYGANPYLKAKLVGYGGRVIGTGDAFKVIKERFSGDQYEKIKKILLTPPTLSTRRGRRQRGKGRHRICPRCGLRKK